MNPPHSPHGLCNISGYFHFVAAICRLLSRPISAPRSPIGRKRYAGVLWIIGFLARSLFCETNPPMPASDSFELKYDVP